MPTRREAEAALIESTAGSLCELMPMLEKELYASLNGHQDTLSRSRLRILLLLKESPKTPGVLAEKLGMARSNLTPLLASLQSDGYIRREASDTDRRSVLLFPTVQGLQAAADFQGQLADLITRWSEKLSHSEMK